MVFVVGMDNIGTKNPFVLHLRIVPCIKTGNYCQDNDYKRYRFRTKEANEGGFRLQIKKEGDWLPALRTFKVRIFGYYENIERVLVDGMEIPFAMDEEVILVDIPENAGSLQIK